MFQNRTENIGGFPYILDYLHIYLPYCIITIIAAILGIAGNLLVIFSVLLNEQLRRNQTCILIVNLGTLIQYYINTLIYHKS